MKWTQLYGSSNILWHCPSLGLEQKLTFSSHVANVFQICWHLECSTLTASSFRIFVVQFGFPGGLAGKESACNAGHPGSIPRSGRSTGEGIGCPLHCFGTSLVAQLVKNLPAMWETQVWSLCWGDPLEKGIAPLSSILAWGIPRQRRLVGYSPWGHKELEVTNISHSNYIWEKNTFMQSVCLMA